MSSAILFGLMAMVAWGFWIIFGDLASDTIPPEMAGFITYIAAAIASGIYLLTTDTSITVTNQGLLFAAGAGVATAIGVVATYIGVTVGSTAVVSTLGGMYFVVTALISIVAFGEPITTKKVAGIGLAVLAVIVLNQ
jgi:uncharacterized membrane protein